jgi:hypothetical protein
MVACWYDTSWLTLCDRRLPSLGFESFYSIRATYIEGRHDTHVAWDLCAHLELPIHLPGVVGVDTRPAIQAVHSHAQVVAADFCGLYAALKLLLVKLGLKTRQRCDSAAAGASVQKFLI